MPNPNPGSARLSAISQHLDAPSIPPPAPVATTEPNMSEPKPPITCHVLDTTVGRPAANIPVTLTLHSSSSSTTSTSSHATTFSATTNADGRVTSWTPSTPFSSTSLADVYASATGDQKYSITLDTEEYFGAKGVQPFFPEVEVKFVVRGEKKSEHYHVPVLLGPFGYTTYRGS